MGDVARRSALTQKQRLDGALLERRRRDVLADLGQMLYDLVATGEIELEDLPELRRGVTDVEELDRQIAEAEAAALGGRGARRPVRLTRTDRREPADPDARVWRPPPTGPEPTGSDPPIVGPGGIVFLEDESAPEDVDPDDSLASYMHDDDVPGR